MKIKYKKLLDSEGYLQILFNATLPKRTSFKIRKSLMPETERVINQFIQARNDLFIKYGREINPEEYVWEILRENLQMFLEEEKSLLNQDAIMNVEQISLADLGENLSIAPAALKQLEWLLV